MKAEDVLGLYTLLQEHGVRIWIDGGWGVDALLERQTRPHKDLDLLVAFDDLTTMTLVLSRRGFILKEIWSENRWLRHDRQVLLIGSGQPGEVATAFVLKDALGREIDVHVLHIDEHGYATPAWDCSVPFLPDALSGQGSIAGSPVRCLSAAMHIRTHTGYQLQDKDIQDIHFLHERFGVDYVPEEREPAKGACEIMDAEIERALTTDSLIDMTTMGRKTGNPHRIEIAFHNFDGVLYITGLPGKRDWYANLEANPHFTFHLKQSVQADLPARAIPITDETERRHILARVVQKWNRPAELDAFVQASPLVKVELEST